jgi:hypothetical protein
VRTGLAVALLSAYKAESRALFDQMTVKPDSSRKKKIDRLIRALMGDGLWSKLDVLYVFAAHDEQAGRLNWKAPGTLTATAVNSPTFTADQGFAGNGTTSYLGDTTFNPATNGVNYTQDSASWGVWSRTSGQMASSSSGWFDGTDGTTIMPRSAADAFNFRINQAAGSATDATVLTGAGLFVANRSASNATQAYANGVAKTVSSIPNQASTALNSAAMRFGSSSAAGFSALQHAAGFAGGSLSAGEQTTLYSILLTYMQGVGAA